MDDGLNGLPDEVLHRVLTYLSPFDLIRLGRVSKHWKNLSEDRTIWRNLTETELLPILIYQTYQEYRKDNVSGDEEEEDGKEEEMEIEEEEEEGKGKGFNYDKLVPSYKEFYVRIAKELRTFEVVVVGEASVGKTSLISSILHFQNNLVEMSRLSDWKNNSTLITMLGNTPAKIVFKDQDPDTFELLPSHLLKREYPKADLFVICYALNNPMSYKSIFSKMTKVFSDTDLNSFRWLLVGTHLDKDDRTDGGTIQLESVSLGTQCLATDGGAVGCIECCLLKDEWDTEGSRLVDLICKILNKNYKPKEEPLYPRPLTATPGCNIL